MDVRCQKCGIEYEFDDAKVTVAGVTVKCTSCGHVFKVKKEEPAPSFGAGALMQDLPRAATATTLPPVTPKTDGAEWMVRQPSGTVFRFKELTTLQKWIVERKVNREDEISKTGKSWKRLGDIAELASFFQVVDAANAALQASIAPVQPSSAPATSTAGSAAAPQQGFVVVHQHQTGGTQVGMPAVTQPGPAAPTATTTVAASDPMPAPPQAPRVPVAPAAASKKPPDADALDDLDEDDPVAQWGKQRKRRNAALLFVLALAVAVGVLVVLKPPFLAALLGDDAEKAIDVDGAYRAVRADDSSVLQNVRTALAAAPPSPLASALTARLLCAEASIAREEERLHGVLRALAPQDAAKHDAGADRANQRASELLATAYPLVTDVRAQSPDLAEAHLAAAAYNLEKGGLSELRSDLEAARAAARNEERGRLDAEIGAFQVLADARAAADKQEPAVIAAAADKVPVSSDGRLAYVKAALAATSLARAHAGKKPGEAPTDSSAARALVDALTVKDARQALLLEVLQTMVTPAAAPDAGVASADAGVADAGVATPVDAGAAGGAPETFEELMRQAERANVNEKHTLARDLFQRAAKLKPGSSRAHLGLGWACLGLDKNGEAQRAFKKAIAIDDGLSDAHLGLAEALRYGGDKPGALEEYKRYLELDPQGKDASVAHRAIEALQ